MSQKRSGITRRRVKAARMAFEVRLGMAHVDSAKVRSYMFLSTLSLALGNLPCQTT